MPGTPVPQLGDGRDTHSLAASTLMASLLMFTSHPLHFFFLSLFTNIGYQQHAQPSKLTQTTQLLITSRTVSVHPHHHLLVLSGYLELTVVLQTQQHHTRNHDEGQPHPPGCRRYGCRPCGGTRHRLVCSSPTLLHLTAANVSFTAVSESQHTPRMDHADPLASSQMVRTGLETAACHWASTASTTTVVRISLFDLP